MTYFVYLLECNDGSYYCGYTKNLDKRVKEHNEGKGARYTRIRKPVKLVFNEKFNSITAALKREIYIKTLSREKKQKLIK